MEILHRRTRPSSDTNTSKNDIPIIEANPSPSRGRIKSRPIITTKNPYTSSTTMTDVILVKCIQVLLILVSIWFIYIIAAVNTSSLDDTPLVTTDYDEDTSQSGLRQSPSNSLQLLNNIPKVNPNDINSARDKISQLRDEFYIRYGGKEMATAMLKKGLRTFENQNDKNSKSSSSIRATANRFLSAIVRHEASISTSQQQAEFVMAFAGYSVTVGRGNHLSQSYPFILEKILAPILQLQPFNIKLIVRNSAIGGIPSFPYGWCLSNFLGKDADLVSWDYGMNEGNGALGLESYVRQSLLMPKSPPLFVLLDMKSGKRLDILQKYVNLQALPDPIALGNKDAVDKKLLQLPEIERPIGLQKWDDWGAPKGAPGQSPWHPKKMEHELMGWMLAMHMLDAIDDALNVMEEDTNWRKAIFTIEQQRLQTSKQVILPPPVHDVSKTGVASMLHGTALSKSNEWHMNHISCRTSFLPNISGEDLHSIIESGVTKVDEDMLQSRDDALFNNGWVMDVGKLERDTKLKVLKYGGLGYIDMKTALYGIPSSGALKLWLPYEGHDTATVVNNAEDASKYINTVVLCEVNEKRGDDECKMVSDLDVRVGNVPIPKSGISQVKDVASYLKKDICIRVEVPKGAKLTTKSSRAAGTNNSLGLALEVIVTRSTVSRENGACSISHVIWENQELAGT